jgi:hypothetical protein
MPSLFNYLLRDFFYISISLYIYNGQIEKKNTHTNPYYYVIHQKG